MLPYSMALTEFSIFQLNFHLYIYTAPLILPVKAYHMMVGKKDDLSFFGVLWWRVWGKMWRK